MNRAMLDLVGSTDQQQPPAGWTLATPPPRIFYTMLEERKLALCTALDVLCDACTELQAPDPGERCFMLPYRAQGWNEYGDSEFERRHVCAAVSFLFECSLAEMRVCEERPGDVLTVMPWKIHASVLETMECVGQIQKGRTS